MVAGKKKDWPKDKPIVVVEDYKSKLLLDRLKTQDLPMLFILTVHYVTHAIRDALHHIAGGSPGTIPLI